jgi:hypothetical protein
MARQVRQSSGGGGAKRAAPRGRGAAPRQTATSRNRGNLLLWSGIILVGLVAVSLPTVMLVGIGMLPTFVAWICDRSEEKFATFCVGGLNFSGVFPYVMELWSGTHSIEAASGIMTNVFSLLVMFGSAGLGWMLFAAVPPVIATFLKVLSERKLTVLRTQQRKLVEEWGEEVRGDSELAPAAAQETAAARNAQAGRVAA